MLILNQSEIRSLLSMSATIDALDAGFQALAHGQVVMPQRAVTPITSHNGLHLSMPAFVGSDDETDPGVLSIKIVSVYGDNVARYGVPSIQGVILLHDARTGKPVALMDAEYITAMRTGAVSGLATRYLARQDAKTVTLFGAGALGPSQLAAICAVRPIEKAFVLTHSGQRDTEFCTQMSTALGIPVAPLRDARAAVEQADVICTATTSSTPLFDGAWLRPGTHVNAVGAYRADMRELDTTTIQRGRVYVDQHAAALTEAGDIVIPLKAGDIESTHILGELSALATGAISGRTHADEITVFKSVGLAMQDAVTVKQVYAAAMAQGMGQNFDL